MPVLSNPRHEKFCQALFRGESATRAYAEAGYRPHQGNSSRLRWFEMVQGRLAELQADAAKSSEITVASLLQELEEARLKASSLEQYGTVVKSIEAKARLAGLTEQRVRVTHINEDCPDTNFADIGVWMAQNWDSEGLELTAEQKSEFERLLRDWYLAIGNFFAAIRAAKPVPQLSPPQIIEHERKRLGLTRGNGRRS